MKKFLDIAFGVVSTILMLIGIAGIGSAFSSNGGEADEMLSYGACCIVISIFLWGFSYIVDAAIIYIEKNEKK